MTFKEWHDFNKRVFHFEDCVVCVLEKDSFDEILESKMNVANALKMFGEYELLEIQISHVDGSDFHYSRFLLWSKGEDSL